MNSDNISFEVNNHKNEETNHNLLFRKLKHDIRNLCKLSDENINLLEKLNNDEKKEIILLYNSVLNKNSKTSK